MPTCLVLTACLALLAPGSRLPDGVVRYWNCDDSAHNAWRDLRWQQGGSPDVAYDPQVKHEGAASLRLTGPGEGQEVWVSSLQVPAEVDPGQEYVLRFFAKTQDVKGEAFLRLLGHQSEGEHRSKPIGWIRLSPKRAEYVLPPNADWQRYEVPVTAFPGGTNKCYFYLGLKGTGTVWYDDLSLALEGVDVPLGGYQSLNDADYAGIRFDDANLPDNLVANSGFEAQLEPWRKMGEKSKLARVKDPTGDSACCVRYDAVQFDYSFLYQGVDVDPRRRYKLSLKAKPDGLTGYLFVRVLPFNSHGQPTGWVGADHTSEFCAVTGKPDTWLTPSQVFSVSPGTASVNLYLCVQDAIGTVYLDDVTLQPLPLEEVVR